LWCFFYFRTQGCGRNPSPVIPAPFILEGLDVIDETRRFVSRKIVMPD